MIRMSMTEQLYHCGRVLLCEAVCSYTFAELTVEVAIESGHLCLLYVQSWESTGKESLQIERREDGGTCGEGIRPISWYI